MTIETLQKANELNDKIDELHCYAKRIDLEIKLLLDDPKRELSLSVNNDSIHLNNADGMCVVSHIREVVEQRIIDYEHQMKEL